jgi:hypothetical protein
LRYARIPSAAYLSDEGAVDARVGSVELRMIEEVEELGAELECYRFGKPCIFEKGDIPIVQTGNFHDVSAGVSEGPKRGGLKAARVKVTVDCTLVAPKVAVTRSICALEGESADICAVSGNGNTKEIARHEARDHVCRPAANQSVGQAAGVGAKSFPFTERKLPDAASCEALANVEIGIAAIITQTIRILVP